jgi:hypothetical protein
VGGVGGVVRQPGLYQLPQTGPQSRNRREAAEGAVEDAAVVGVAVVVCRQALEIALLLVQVKFPTIQLPLNLQVCVHVRMRGWRLHRRQLSNELIGGRGYVCVGLQG